MDHTLHDHGVCFARWAGLALWPLIWVGQWEGDLSHHPAFILVILGVFPSLISNNSHRTSTAGCGTVQNIPYLITIGIFQEGDPAAVFLVVLEAVVGISGYLLLVSGSGALLLLPVHAAIVLASSLDFRAPPLLRAYHDCALVGMLVEHLHQLPVEPLSLLLHCGHSTDIIQQGPARAAEAPLLFGHSHAMHVIQPFSYGLAPSDKLRVSSLCSHVHHLPDLCIV
jgi:hypothetical protein